MANKPLKSIKFPELPDTYTIPQVDPTPTQGSTNAVQSGGVYSALDGLQAQIPQIDPTLTQSGQAADAKKTGDEITSLKEDLNEIDDLINTSISELNYIEDKNLNSSTGALVDEEGTCVSDWIPYTWTGSAGYDCGDNTKSTYIIDFYDANKNHISGFRNPSSTGGATYRWINVETQVTGGTVAYVRLSFKKGTIGKVFSDAQTNYWIATSTTVKGVFPSIGSLNNLDTTNKDNLVGAINEINAKIPEIPEIPQIDPTLTQPGQAADAKVTGDALDALVGVNSRLTQLDSTVNGETTQNFVEGKNISTDGSLVDATDICVSDFVPITWSGYNNYFCNDNTVQYKYIIAFYDANKTYIQQFKNPATAGGAEYRGVNHETQVTQGTAVFVRFSFKSGTVGKIMNSNRTETLWESEITVDGGVVSNIGDLSNLNTENKGSLVGAVNEINQKIPDAISPEDTTFFMRSMNLCDPATCVVGQYVNQTTGAFSNNSTHQRTDYIPVEPNKSYFVVMADNTARDTRYAFYKSDKTFISGGLISGSGGLQTITSPANAVYMVASIASIYYDIMVAQTDEVIPFESYTLYIDPRHINMGSKAKLNLPVKIYAVVGFELNIYFENITEDWTKYDWDVTCSVGRQMERGYQVTPVAADVGTKTLTVKATDEYGNVNTVITSLVITAATAGSGQSKSVIVLGDSTTNNGIAVTKLNENFTDDVMNVTTLGTRGTAPNNHEGRSGWKMSDYFTTEYIDYTDGRGHVENPFFNPSTQTFDAEYYFTNSGIAVPDFFVLNMGINDVFSYITDTALDSGINQFISYVDVAITSIKAAAPNTKICICCTIPPNHSQDAFGKAYACGQARNRCKRNNTLLVDRIIEEYDGRESESIYVIPIHTNLDTVYNMGMETLPVNARNTEITYQSPIQNGGVHPVASGYWQIADVYTAFLKAHAED